MKDEVRPNVSEISVIQIFSQQMASEREGSGSSGTGEQREDQEKQ